MWTMRHCGIPHGRLSCCWSSPIWVGTAQLQIEKFANMNQFAYFKNNEAPRLTRPRGFKPECGEARLRFLMRIIARNSQRICPPASYVQALRPWAMKATGRRGEYRDGWLCAGIPDMGVAKIVPPRVRLSGVMGPIPGILTEGRIWLG